MVRANPPGHHSCGIGSSLVCWWAKSDRLLFGSEIRFWCLATASYVSLLPMKWFMCGPFGSRRPDLGFLSYAALRLQYESYFSMKSLIWHTKPACDDFHDISCPPLKRASWVHDFTFDSFFIHFTGPISPIYSFLRCFYQAHKPEPKKVTKSYEKLQTTYEKLANSYKKLRKRYETVTKSYKKLWKLKTTYEITFCNSPLTFYNYFTSHI